MTCYLSVCVSTEEERGGGLTGTFSWAQAAGKRQQSSWNPGSGPSGHLVLRALGKSDSLPANASKAHELDCSPRGADPTEAPG